MLHWRSGLIGLKRCCSVEYHILLILHLRKYFHPFILYLAVLHHVLQKRNTTACFADSCWYHFLQGLINTWWVSLRIDRFWPWIHFREGNGSLCCQISCSSPWWSGSCDIQLLYPSYREVDIIKCKLTETRKAASVVNHSYHLFRS